jgi:hypothetical protein
VKKFFASFFQERRVFFSEEKKQKTFYYAWMIFVAGFLPFMGTGPLG